MLDDIKRKLSDEADALLHELNVVLPREIEKAAALGDLRENSEYSAALERQGFVRAKLDYIARRLSAMGEIDAEKVPVDRVGFGSRVTVRDAEDGTIEEFTLTLGDHLDFENSEISMESPIARALLGKRPGDRVSASLPVGSREYEILGLQTLHEILKDGRPGEG